MVDVLVLVGFIGVFALILAANLRGYWLAYGRLPTFAVYRERHPELFKHGRCYCRCCGSGRIYVHSLTAQHRRHICATCGTVLYRS